MSFTPATTSADHPTIRPYTEKDWPSVCRIHDAARVQELAAGNVDPRAFQPMTKAAKADEFFDSQTVLACLDHRVLGFVSWNGAYITWLYVDPDIQRRGVGRRLLEHALQQIGPEAWTNVIAENSPALALYLRAGFEIVCQRPGDCDGFPCESMRVALPTSRMRNPDARRRDLSLPTP